MPSHHCFFFPFSFSLCIQGVSSTRQLEEAMFYFRAAPSASTSPQPLRGHTAQNSATEPSQRKSVSRHGASRRGQGEGEESAKMDASLLSKLSSSEGVPNPGSESAADEAERPVGERRKRRRSRIWEQLPERPNPGSKVIDKTEQNIITDNNTTASSDSKAAEMKTSVTVQNVYNGSLRRMNSSQHQGKMMSEKVSNVKNWGSFRIPKRSDSKGAEGEQEVEGRDFTHSHPIRSLEASHTPTSPPIRTRLRTGTENRDLGSDADHSQSEQKKRCHAQRLRSHDPVTQRYGSEVLWRGVLAS